MAKKATSQPSLTATPKKQNKATKAKKPTKPEGLRGPQVEILSMLAKAANGVARNLIPQKLAKVCNLSEMLGNADGSSNQYTTTLQERKYVKFEQHDVDGKDTVVVSITAAGRKALAAAKKAGK